MSDIAKAYVQLVPSAKGFSSGISSALDPEMHGAGEKAGGKLGGSIIGKVKGLIATAGIGAAIGKAVSSGAELEQSIGGIETLFKDSADTVMASAKNAFKTAGMSANEYMQTVTGFSASLLQGLGGDTAKAASISDMALTDMSDNANKMGTDMESIKNAYGGFAKQNYTMLDNLKLGYGGTKTEMERLLKDAQKLSGVEYNIDNLSDVYSAIHVIQGEMGITGTTAKEASSTISGSAASMKAAFTDLLGNIALGKPIGDSLKNLSDSVFTFAKNLLPAVGNILMGLPDVLNSAFSAAIQALNLAANNADTLVQQGVDLVISLGSSIITAAPYLIEAAYNLVSAIGNALITTDWTEVITNTVGNLRNSLSTASSEILGTDGSIIDSTIAAIDAGIPKMLESGVSMIQGIIGGIAQTLPTFVETAASTLSSFVNMLISHLPDLINSGKEILSSLIDGIRQSYPSMIASAGDAIISMVTGLVQNLPNIISAGMELIVSLIEGIGKALPDLITAAVNLGKKIWEAIKDIDWLQLGKDIIRGLINGIGAMGNALWQAAKNIARSALDGIKHFLGINSPSRVMRDEVGKFIPAGLAVGIEANTQPVKDAMRDLSGITVGSAQAEAPAMTESFQKAAYSAPSVSAANTHTGSGDLKEIMALISDIQDANSESDSKVINLMEDIIDIVANINLTDETIYEAADRYRRKRNVAVGGAVY